MNKEENRELINRVEQLVKPEDVTAISFLGDFNKYLPKKIQDKMMAKGSEKVPYMGFIVDPYCFFLGYEIIDRKTASAMLSDNYELAEAAFFKGDDKKPLVVISAFTARTSAFIGMRLEAYIIARHKKTGLMSWIIADYETNTNSHDPKNGFCGYSSESTVFTVSPYGELLAQVKGKRGGRFFSLRADIKEGDMDDLDRELWVEGNLSVDYGGEIKSETSRPFSLIFDPVLMKEAKRISLDRVNIAANTYLDRIIDGKHPVTAALFPYGQHFFIKQDLKGQGLKDEGDLERHIGEFMGRTGYKTMAGDDIKKPLFKGILISSLANGALILFLLLKLFLRAN